jgi:hypothetical protein
MSFDWNAYREELSNQTPEVEWEDAADLSRLSLGSFMAEQNPVRRDLSLGFFRLTGEGVNGHAAHIDDVADAIRHFQRLVLASGLALGGYKSLQGSLPADVVSRTRLDLEGSPMPGSLVLQILPATSPADEIMPSGQAEFWDSGEDQLVDTAVANSLELLNLSKSVGPNADDSDFIRLLAEAGPRVASTLRDFAKSLASSNFETEIAWMQPRRKKSVSRMSVAELQFVGTLVASRELAKEPATLRGVLHTVSDVAPLRLETADGELINVGAKSLPDSDIKRLLVGMTVELTATVTEEVAPGSEPKTKYTATNVVIIGDEAS